MKYLLSLLVVLLNFSAICQTVKIDGYVYETGNRGYISGVNITVEDQKTDRIIAITTTDTDGYFKVDVPPNTNVRLYATKDMFDVKRIDIPIERGDAFVKLEIGRKPGYKFEVTLAEARSNENIIADAIKGARIEVYNNTTRESIMDLKQHMSPQFQLNLEKGNHYTILIRKEGYLSKRMEAKVDVEGCILCFEGVGTVNPGVSDNLTEGNAFGVLLANVELERIFTGKKMEVQNLYYASARWSLDRKAKKELAKVITLMKDNPNLSIELGAHTDSKGGKQQNLTLSKKRAKAAVNYLISKGDIDKSRIISKGYGETILLNDCGDESNCTSKEHAINRRTELKIIGITDVSEIKSLAKMKQEEYMDEEILNLMNQKEVRAESIEELEKSLNEQISEKTSVDTLKTTQASKAEDSPNNNTSTTTLISEEKDIARKEEITEHILEETKISDITDVPSTTQNHTTPANSNLTETSTDHQTKTMKENTEVIKVGMESKIDLTKKEVSKKKSNASFDDMPGLDVIDPKSKTIENYKIVLYSSTEPLSEEHPIFKQHKDAAVFSDKEKVFNYIIGNFESKTEAESFFKIYIKPQYKDSFLAIFKDDKLTKI